MDKIGLILVIFWASVACNTSNSEHEKQYTFHDPGNYYYDASYSKEHTLDSSAFPLADFIVFDEADFLNSERYSYYLIQLTESNIPHRCTITSVKSIDTVTIVSSAIMVLNNGQPTPGLNTFSQIARHKGCLSNKQSWSIGNTVAISIKEKADELASKVHEYSVENSSFGDVNTIFFYFDGKRYYILNAGFTDQHSLQTLSNFISGAVLARSPFVGDGITTKDSSHAD